MFRTVKQQKIVCLAGKSGCVISLYANLPVVSSTNYSSWLWLLRWVLILASDLEASCGAALKHEKKASNISDCFLGLSFLSCNFPQHLLPQSKIIFLYWRAVQTVLGRCELEAAQTHPLLLRCSRLLSSRLLRSFLGPLAFIVDVCIFPLHKTRNALNTYFYLLFVS